MKVIPVLIFTFAIIGSGHTRSGGWSDSRSTRSYRLLDVLEYTCTHMPAMEHLKYFFSDHLSPTLNTLETVTHPICSYILQVAGNFDVAEFCKFTTHYFDAIRLFDSNDRVRQYLPDPNFFTDMIQRLYGVDLHNLTTLCPNAYRFFEPSLEELIDEFLTEFITDVLSHPLAPMYNDLDSICKDRKRFYVKLGVQNGSVHYQKLADILLELGSDFAGYQSYDSFCEDIALIVNQGDADRRKSSKKLVLVMRKKVLGALGFKIKSTRVKEEL